MNDLEVKVDVERISRYGLKRFIELAWHQVEPATQYQHNWHIDAISEHLEAVTLGQIKRLVINIPPGSMKSLCVSVFWPAWQWTLKPSTKWIFASYAANISKRDNIRSKRLIDSPWYQERWGHVFKANDNDWGAFRFSNNQAGHRIAVGVGAMITGEHADIQVVDDPIKPMDVTGFAGHDAANLDKIWDWWTGTMSSRCVDANSARVIVMQRLGENDLTGRVLEEGGWEHLCLPMLFEKERRCSTSIGFLDPRTQEDELLWPERFPLEAVEQRKKEMGARSWASQDQQRPSPAAGALFKRSWLSNFYTEIPKPFGTMIQSWDATFKGDQNSDFVVGQVWMEKGGCYYLLDMIRARMSFTETQAAIIALSSKWPSAHLKLIEAAANGPALVDSLKSKINGIVAEPVKGQSKIYRAVAHTAIFEAGNVVLPHPTIAPWVSDFIEELASFPGGTTHDDMVDACSQALNRLSNSKTSLYLKALGRLG